MHEKKSFSMRAEEFLAGKGFYIVLFVCVAVIGVSAWLLLFSQFSPLAVGDEGDYLDVMGDVTTPPAGEDDEPAKSTDTPNTTTQPEHTVPKPSQNTDSPNEPDSGALTVKDTPAKPETPATDETPPAPENPEDKADEPTAGQDLAFVWPVNGEISARYSPAALIYDKTMGDWRTHNGIDIAAKLGTKVLSCANGTVTRMEEDDRYGTVVEIDHGAGLVSCYANLAGMPTVKVGDAVAAGSVIGSVGSTALYETGDDSHLHFALTLNGDPADPADYLPQK